MTKVFVGGKREKQYAHNVQPHWPRRGTATGVKKGERYEGKNSVSWEEAQRNKKHRQARKNGKRDRTQMT